MGWFTCIHCCCCTDNERDRVSLHPQPVADHDMHEPQCIRLESAFLLSMFLHISFFSLPTVLTQW